MSNRYAIVNAEGEVVRSVQLSDSWLKEAENSELILVQAGPGKRLEILAGDGEFAELQKKLSKLRWKFQEVARLSKDALQQEKDLGAGLTWRPLQNHLPLFADQSLQKASSKRFGFALGVVSVSVMGFLLTILNLNIGMQKLEQELKQQVVQIVKKIPPKKTSVQATMNSQSVQPKTPEKASLQRMGALSVLGSLSKSQQRGGLNLGAVQTTAGPGLGGNAGSGGVQTNIYARGAVAAPLGAGGNLQGGGGYGTKGKGGGQAGYGNLSIVGSKGTSSIPLTSEASVGGGLDKDLIGAVIAKNLGQIRFCYEQGLQLDASLHGRVAVDFTIDASGAVKLAQVQSSSLNSKQVEDCMVLRLKGWKFPIPENGKDVKVSYPFVLRRSGQG